MREKKVKIWTGGVTVSDGRQVHLEHFGGDDIELARDHLLKVGHDITRLDCEITSLRMVGRFEEHDVPPFRCTTTPK